MARVGIGGSQPHSAPLAATPLPDTPTHSLPCSRSTPTLPRDCSLHLLFPLPALVRSGGCAHRVAGRAAREGGVHGPRGRAGVAGAEQEEGAAVSEGHTAPLPRTQAASVSCTATHATVTHGTERSLDERAQRRREQSRRRSQRINQRRVGQFAWREQVIPVLNAMMYDTVTALHKNTTHRSAAPLCTRQ